MPSFSFGGWRGLLLALLLLGVVVLLLLELEGLLLRAPGGTGGLRRGTGDGMARLFCLSPGKNNSFGSARVARLVDVEVCWVGEEISRGRNKERPVCVSTTMDRCDVVQCKRL